MEKLKIDPTDIHQVHQNSTLDVRAEVILTELIRNGTRSENLLFNLAGTLNRPFRKDILEFKMNDFFVDKIDVKLCREGLYDYLPKNLFFPLYDSSGRSSAADMTGNVRENNIIEAAARKFFAPLDNYFSHLRIEAEQEARSLNEASGINNQGPLGIIWELPDYLKPNERNLLILLLPFTRQIVSNSTLLTGFYSLFFNLPFEISTSSIVEKSEYYESLSLGECFLGYSSIIEGNMRDEYTLVKLDYTISNQQELERFKPDSREDKLIDFLNGFFLPLECLYLKQPTLNAIIPQLQLGSEAHYILDYSAYLSE
jgi:hypothetical protein